MESASAASKWGILVLIWPTGIFDVFKYWFDELFLNFLLNLVDTRPARMACCSCLHGLRISKAL